MTTTRRIDGKVARYQAMADLPVTAWAVMGWLSLVLPIQGRRTGGVGLLTVSPATIHRETGATSVAAVHHALQELHERGLVVWSPMRQGGSGVVFVVGSVGANLSRERRLLASMVVATFVDCPAREAAQAEIDASRPRAAVEAPTPPPEPRAPTADVVRRRRRAA